MKIIFYDINLLNHKKYIGDIINLCISNKDEVFILYDENNQEGFDYFRDKDCKIIKNTSITYKGIKNTLNNISPDILMVNAQRLSDSAFVAVAKNMNIKTGMIQHGMYIPFMKREKFYLLKKAVKTLKYFMYSQVIAKAINENGIEVFTKFVKTFIKGAIYKEVVDFYYKINVDFVLVYGEYWKEYHRDIFGYSFEQQYIIGYHELNKIDKIKSKFREENSLCYIAQTLVEDGRMERKTMIEFIDNLEKITKGMKVYIKLHPRSDKTLFCNRNFTLLETEIPNCEFYLGHYSSLLALVGYLKSQVVLYEFKDHPIPDYFKEFSIIVNNCKDISSAMKNIYINQSDKIEKYFACGYNTKKVVDLIYKEGKIK